MFPYILIFSRSYKVHGSVQVQNEEGQNEEDRGQAESQVHAGEDKGGEETKSSHEGDVDNDDVSSCNESIRDSFIEEDLVDVSIHNDDDEDDSWEGNGHGSVPFGGVSVIILRQLIGVYLTLI